MSIERIWYCVLVFLILSATGIVIVARRSKVKADAAEEAAIYKTGLTTDLEPIRETLKKNDSALKDQIERADDRVRAAEKKLDTVASAPAESSETNLERLKRENEAQRELIEAQRVAIQERDLRIANLEATVYLDATMFRRQQAELIEKDAQIAAAKGAMKGQRWLGRFEGFAVGVATDRAVALIH